MSYKIRGSNIRATYCGIKAELILFWISFCTIIVCEYAPTLVETLCSEEA